MIINKHHFGSVPAKLETMCVIVIGFIAPCIMMQVNEVAHQCKLSPSCYSEVTSEVRRYVNKLGREDAAYNACPQPSVWHDNR